MEEQKIIISKEDWEKKLIDLRQASEKLRESVVKLKKIAEELKLQRSFKNKFRNF